MFFCEFFKNLFNKKTPNEKKDQRFYIELWYDGMSCNWEQIDEIDLNEYFFYKVKFYDNNVVRFYVKDDLAFENKFDEIKNESCKLMFYIYFQLKKEQSGCNGCFDIKCTNAKLKDYYFSTTNDTLTIFDKCCVVQKLDSAGNIISPEEDVKQQKEILSERLRKTLSDLPNNKIYLSEENKKRFYRLFQVKDIAIEYCLMYSWLDNLCGNNQNKTQSFIKQSIAYNNFINTKGAHIPGVMERFNDKKGKKVKEDSFTCCRNLVGHTFSDLLKFSDDKVLGYLTGLRGILFLILLEKIEEQSKGANQQ